MDGYQNSYPHTHTLSSTSVEFESFTFPISPHDIISSSFSPADELIFKGQLLPLEPTAREATMLSLLSSSSTHPSSETTEIASPNSTTSIFFPSSSSSSSSSNAVECDSSQCNSATNYDEYRRHHDPKREYNGNLGSPQDISLSKFSSRNTQESEFGFGSKSGKRSSSLLKEIVSSYFNKVNHLCKKLLKKHQQQHQQQNQNIFNIENVSTTQKPKISFPRNNSRNSKNSVVFLHCVSGNLQHPRRKSGISSHSGLSCKKGFSSSNQVAPTYSFLGNWQYSRRKSGISSHSDASCKKGFPSSNQVVHIYHKELIEEAIAYCKNSKTQ